MQILKALLQHLGDTPQQSVLNSNVRYLTATEIFSCEYSCSLDRLRVSALRCWMLQLEVLAQLSRHDFAFLRSAILPGIIRLFSTRRALLEASGSYVFRKLCQLLDPQAIYLYLAEILLPLEDIEFVTLTIEILNLLLLTSVDLVRASRCLVVVSMQSLCCCDRKAVTAPERAILPC